MQKKDADTNSVNLKLWEDSEDALMPVTGYRVQYKEAGSTWDKYVDFEKGLYFSISFCMNIIYLL